MTFATLKENQATKKFELIRLEPARFLNDLLTSIGGGKYTYSTNYFVSKVQENGVDLSLVVGTPSIGEYSFSSGVLTIYPNAAPSSTNALVMFHYLYLTGETYRVWHSDPENTATDLVDWEPIVKNYPIVNQSIEDILSGKLSISSSSLGVINDQSKFNQYFTINDSFYKKEIKVWACIQDETNIQKIFEGKIVSISQSNGVITFGVKDNSLLLTELATMGDSRSDAYHNIDDNPTLDPNKNGLAIPYIVGTLSRCQYIDEGTTSQKLDHETLYEAVCINYSANISTSNNRDWGLCRTDTAFTGFGHTPTSIDQTNPSFTILNSSASDVAKMFAGDTFIVTISSVDHYMIVKYVDRVNNKIYCNKDAALSTNDVVTSNNCPSIVVYQDQVAYYCQYGRDYTATVTTTSGGNKYLTITFANNFEANHAGMVDLNPQGDRVLYRVHPAIKKHGDILKLILEKSGMTVNSASITAANASLNVNAAFSIPYFDENDFKSYYSYIQDILKSTFGFIFLNNSFEIEYKLFSTPSSSTTLTETEILKDSFSSNIEYQDITTQLIAYNPHFNSSDHVAKTGVSAESNKAIHLHGVTNVDRFIHVLEDITGRINDIMNYKSNRSAKYNLETATFNLDSEIGDEFLVETDLYGLTQESMKIIAISKQKNKASLILTDLKGV